MQCLKSIAKIFKQTDICKLLIRALFYGSGQSQVMTFAYFSDSCFAVKLDLKKEKKRNIL